ncbi:hypothetical protein FSP39_010467 [Pinctada imbricata]|uniref:EGF-like domain-containing protein n=1 Tax=Pinctada imbricata TaxID=66713 RepID=A0AA88XJV0_PINIB|nr:hypothetical protein FSP39_010467 [Pinctada imbricata]
MVCYTDYVELNNNELIVSFLIIYFSAIVIQSCMYFTDMDECASGPCQNNGKCTDMVNAYECRCKTGYSGYHCEIGIQLLRTTIEDHVQDKQSTTSNNLLPSMNETPWKNNFLPRRSNQSTPSKNPLEQRGQVTLFTVLEVEMKDSKEPRSPRGHI